MQPPSTGRSQIPPLISFRTAADLKQSLLAVGPLSSSEEHLFDKLVRVGLPPLLSPTVLGQILGISPKLITAMAQFPRKYYRRYEIPKRSGGKRLILAPRSYLKVVQRYILKSILEKQPLLENVTGFVRGRNIVMNASRHTRARYLLNVDAKNFFGSVRRGRVVELFGQIGFPQAMSQVLGALCTYDGVLPQGAPTSPYLANLVFQEVDTKILTVCGNPRITYSRYADDLSFSCAKPIGSNFITKLGSMLLPFGFKLNPKKTRYSRPGQAKYVTGLVVNEKVHPDRRTRRLLRAMFHRASTVPRKMKGKSAQLAGWASYVNSYNPVLGRDYLSVARKVEKL